MNRIFLSVILLSLLVVKPAVAAASVTEKDVMIVARIISLLQDAPKGRVEVAVVRNGPASHEDADEFLSRIGSGKTVGDVTLVATEVAPDQLAGTNAQVVIVPSGVDPAHFAQIFNMAEKKQILTISNSDACLVAQKCAIAIKSEPAVDIRMSQSASHATGVSFGSALRMMIKETP